MKKVLGCIFALFALAEIVAIYPLLKLTFELTIQSGSAEDAKIPEMTLIGLGIAVVFLVAFTVVSIWFFRTSDRTDEARETER